jgi:hypothetical protein
MNPGLGCKPPTGEGEIRKIMVWGYTGQKVCKISSQPLKTAKQLCKTLLFPFNRWGNRVKENWRSLKLHTHKRRGHQRFTAQVWLTPKYMKQKEKEQSVLKTCNILTLKTWAAEQGFGPGLSCFILILYQFISCFSILVNPLPVKQT